MVPGSDQPSVLANAARLERDAVGGAWPEQCRPDPAVCRRVGFVVAAIAPHLAYERLSVLVRYALWTIVLDDELDGPGVDTAALDHLRAGVAAVTAGRRIDEPLLTDLAGILRELSELCREDAVLPRLGAALDDAVISAAEHAALGRAVAAGTAPAPTAEQYAEAGARTVNYRSFAYALLAVAAGGLTGAALDRIDPALEHAALAVRLGNDLRSVARDAAESTLNVLDLRTEDGTPVTPRYVHQQIDLHVRAHDDVLRSLPDCGLTDLDSAEPTRTLTRSLRLSLGLYQLTDLR